MSHLTIVRGLPGSGKSTYARQLVEQTGVCHFEADMWFEQSGTYQFDHAQLKQAHDWCIQETYRAVMQSNRAVVANTFLTVNTFLPYLDFMMEQPRPLVDIVELTTVYGSIRGVPDETLLKMQKNMVNNTTLQRQLAKLYPTVLINYTSI